MTRVYNSLLTQSDRMFGALLSSDLIQFSCHVIPLHTKIVIELHAMVLI